MVELGVFQGSKERNIDIVFCIDGTGSMVGCIDNVKNHAKRFNQELTEALVAANTNITMLRVKVIVFRDYGVDKDAMEISKFFELPADTDEFEAFVNKIDPHGGGDIPENGLEALYYAMKSDWVTEANDRQIIVLFTDAEALEMGARKGEPGYPADMVDFAGLETAWVCKDSQDTKLRDRLKRMVVFAPVGTIYEQRIAKGFDRVIYEPVTPENGMEEIDFSSIINSIVKSATSV